MSETTHSSTDYPYVDQTKDRSGEAGEGITAKSTSGLEEASQAVLNPAFYPKHSKPEALHNEAEKAGSEFPTGDPHAVASGETSDGEELSETQEAALTQGSPAPVAAGTGPSSEGSDGGEEVTDEEYEQIDEALAKTVDEAAAWAEQHPELIDAIIQREEEGQNRSTLIPKLESIKAANESTPEEESEQS